MKGSSPGRGHRSITTRLCAPAPSVSDNSAPATHRSAAAIRKPRVPALRADCALQSIPHPASRPGCRRRSHRPLRPHRPARSTRHSPISARKRQVRTPCENKIVLRRGRGRVVKPSAVNSRSSCTTKCPAHCQLRLHRARPSRVGFQPKTKSPYRHRQRSWRRKRRVRQTRIVVRRQPGTSQRFAQSDNA